MRNSRGGVVKILLLLAMLLPGAGMAQHDREDGRERAGRHHRRWTPEFDPAVAGTIAALVAGGGVLLARRRRP